MEVENIYPVDELLDASHLPCPQPLLMTKKIMTSLNPGAVLKVVTRDPSFKLDFAVFAKKSGHKLLQSWQEGQSYVSLIQKAN